MDRSEKAGNLRNPSEKDDEMGWANIPMMANRDWILRANGHERLPQAVCGSVLSGDWFTNVHEKTNPQSDRLHSFLVIEPGFGSSPSVALGVRRGITLGVGVVRTA